MGFVLPNLLIRIFIPPEKQCRADGGTPAWKENGEFVCVFPDDNTDDKPFYRNPTDEHNVPRPRKNDTTNERRTDDTEDDTEQPEPKPLPDPSPPPVTFDDDTDDRRPVPNPPQTEPPDTPPNVPVRRLPKDDDFITITIPNTPSSVTLEKKLQTVKDDALSRVYGCMLHSPITSSPAIFRICEQPSDTDINERITEETENFFEFLISKLRDTVAEEGLTATCVLAMNLLPSNFLRYLPQGQLLTVFGCSYLSEIASEFLFASNNAYQSIDGQGHINVKYIDCTPPENDDTGDFTKGLQPEKKNINECFVPIRNFKTNEPEQLGMKTQLQVVYELIEEIDDTDPVEYKTWNKQITIPSPQEDLTAQNIKDVFPETLNFGEIKAEFTVEPYGYVRFYANETDYDNGDTDVLFDDIVDNLIEGDEKEDSRRFSKRTRSLKTGEFTRKKAFLYKWESDDGKPPLCRVYDLA